MNIPLSDVNQNKGEVLPFSITLNKDGDWPYFAAEPIENDYSKFSCNICVKKLGNNFYMLVNHMKSSHLEGFSLKTACSICGLSQEFKEIHLKNHFRKHFIEDKIEECRLAYANADYKDPISPNCSVKDLNDKIDVVLVLADDEYVYRCEECNIYFKISRNFLNHVGPKGPHCHDYPQFHHEINPSNVWCKICKLKLTGFQYATVHARKSHRGVRRVEFEMLSSVKKDEESDDREPARKKRKR